MEMVSSCKRSRTPRPKKCFVDRLSALPDDILHRVFSYLDFLDVVRTSVLSKRWRFVWTSVPFLNFNMDWFVKHNYNKKFELMEPRYKFWDFIKWALLLRDGSQIIRICLYTDNTITEQLNGLLRVAARQKVQELCFLDGDYTADELDFPRVLCETLTQLTVNFRDTIPLRVTAVFSSLRSLNLTRVLISSDVAQKLLSSDCVKLENVYLEDCQVRDVEEISILACNLKNLTIVNVCTYEKFWVVGSFDSKLRIFAPNLISFCYIGPMLRGFALLNTMSLESASIRLLRVPRGYEDEYKNHLICPARFIGLNHAKALTLSTLVVKYFCPAYGELLWDTFILDNLNHLELELRYNANYIEGLVNLLKFSPNLESLFIRFKEARHIPRSQRKKKKAIENRSSWESRLEDIACLSYHVKIIRISNLDGTEIALELVKFLLQNGKVLEKMELMPRNGERKQKSFSKVVAFPKASARVVISFPDYAQRKIPWFDKGDSDPEYDD
ncbi:FBD-associated F-box protein At4g13985-like [Sesamum indicum]|uniref:FBD-associated F-box protein At4g13985-like n=1 Tax=Sesamum indicum TaxID=4182 RepID=A0A8M8ULK1_SESIN|nr:FBD-associated F-box protein At4g13985-like [Sesamum indicum]XP_020547130.1 FBD-associated F-box protein At4g13985-like [Sesamum indicum]XP_020547131.1 FBD-associated F-box protein At4g13985-like [Sesamum indicum]XP_020547132.1 FBD-associated F-box protein At4g13985-like [Sesamum indicum]XP_020547133.1 FBD-associated F-box protein At4g13985-like [Sesamum indicum]XP_020547134.1 FBD-associated F-box protein At4g13985-like [Sesamum indicum]XP_020547135.1 FBD-associated F-box protein At4g13985